MLAEPVGKEVGPPSVKTLILYELGPERTRLLGHLVRRGIAPRCRRKTLTLRVELKMFLPSKTPNKYTSLIGPTFFVFPSP